MKITLLNAHQVGKELDRLMKQTQEFYWAVAWANDMPLANTLINNKSKIKQIVIGTDFTHTSPLLLDKLKTEKNVHVMISNGRTTFHPKIYCFVDGNNVSAIIGSANFTNGGTNLNDEAALLLEGRKDDDGALIEILDSIDSWWSKGKEIEAEFLSAYELRWQANQKHKHAIEKPLKIYHPTEKSTNPKLLSMSWDDYIKNIMNEPNSNIDVRLAVLKGARTLFNSVGYFKALDELPRKAIAGIIGNQEILNWNDEDLRRLNWGWFGSMKGAGTFKNFINTNNQHLSDALDCIPPTGAVTEDDYNRFRVEFIQAFVSSTKKGGVPTASRLLAMKRPDYFVCVDSKNAKGLGADLGFPPSKLTLGNYWENVVEPITLATWWNASRPTDTHAEIWDARAAMLDVIYKTRKMDEL